MKQKKEIKKKDIQWGRKKRFIKKSHNSRGNLVTEIVRTVKN